MLAVRLSNDIEHRLENLARVSGRTKSYYAREAINSHIENMEDLYLAEQRVLANRACKSRTWTLEEVGRELGMAN